MATKSFHLGDILSITTGLLGIGDVYDILGFMTGKSLFAHQLPQAIDVCKSVLLEEHPQLKDVDDSNVNRENYHRWLAEQVAKYGEVLPVSSLADREYEAKNLFEGLHEMAPKVKVSFVIFD